MKHPQTSPASPRGSLLLALALASPAALAAGLSGCESPKPPRAAQTEMVPSNSAYEAASAKPRVVTPPESSPDDPGGPAPAGGGGAEAPSEPGPTAKGGSTVTATLPASGPTPTGTTAAAVTSNQKPTRAECMQVIDRYVELEVQSNPALQGIPPDMLKQLLKTAKGQATAQKGDPCKEENITRAKYNCAMGAPTREAWKACMK